MANLSISTAWNETAAFMKRESGLVLPIALLLFAVPGAAFQLAMPAPPAPGQPPEVGTWLLLLPLVMIATLIASLAITYLALRPGASVGEGLQVGARRLLPLLLASILIALGVTLLFVPFLMVARVGVTVGSAEQAMTAPVLFAFLAFLLFTLALWVRLILMTSVAAVEPVGPIAIIRRSWDLTRGHFWQLAAALLLMLVVFLVALLAITTIVGIFVFMVAGPPAPGNTSMIVLTILSALIQSIFSAIFITMLARIYAQLSGSVPKDVFA